MGNKRATPLSKHHNPALLTYRGVMEILTLSVVNLTGKGFENSLQSLGYAEGVRKALTIPLVYSFIVSGLLKQ